MDNKTVRIIITGKRSFNDYDVFKNIMDDVLRNLKSKVLMNIIDEFESYGEADDWYKQNYNIEIICGMATGTDLLAIMYCIRNEFKGIKLVPFEPEFWKYGEKAGEVRNQAMLDYAMEADEAHVYAFWDITPGGTKDMIDRARLADIDIAIYHINTGEIHGKDFKYDKCIYKSKGE